MRTRFARGWLRWWDGAQWTAHQTTTVPQQPTFYGMVAPTPQRDLESETRWARYAVWSFAAGAVLYGLVLAIGDPLIARWFKHVYDTCRVQLDNGATTCHQNRLNSLQSQLVTNLIFSLPLAADVVMMIWLRRAAEIARRLGLPARRSPTWAFGFFVPVVNLWFPYQVAADTVPPGAPERAVVGWWWALRVVQLLAGVPIFIVGLFSFGTAVAVGVVAAALPVLQAVYGARMVGAILAVHRGLVARTA